MVEFVQHPTIFHLLWAHKDAQSLGAQDAQIRTVPECTGRSKTHFDREEIKLCHDKMYPIRHDQNKFPTHFDGAEHKY